MVKHTINISTDANVRIKILKTQYGLKKVSDVIEKVLIDTPVVVK